MSDQNPYSAPAADLANTPVDPDRLRNPGSAPAGRGWGWIADGFEYFKQAPGTWIGMMVIWFIISIALAFIPLMSLVLTVLSPVFLGGLMLGCRAIDDNQDLRIEHLFAGFNTRLGPLLAVGGLYLAGSFGIVIVAGIIVAVIGGVGMMGSGGDTEAMQTMMASGLSIGLVIAALLAVLLFIPLLMAFWFAPALVVHHEVPAFEAMKLSFTGCLRNIMPFLVYGLCAMGLSLLAMIPLGLGLLVLSPVLIASVYVAYKEIYLSA
jgi:uncharacterized membrane protein